MEGSELRLQLEDAEQEHRSALASVQAAADERVAAKGRVVETIQSELSSRQLLQQAAGTRSHIGCTNSASTP